MNADDLCIGLSKDGKPIRTYTRGLAPTKMHPGRVVESTDEYHQPIYRERHR
jgi:hypothetical protein